jgi:polysaccharide biosynthesis/export protein
VKKIISVFTFVLFIIIGLIFTSCRVITSNEMFKTPEDYSYSEFKPSEKEYVIQPFDKLDMKLFSNDGFKLVDVTQTLSQQQNVINYTVEFDGLIKLPTIGRVDISGKTIREAEKFLEDKFSEYFVNPFVIINVTNKRVVIFAGGASNGKVLTINNDNFTLIEALAEAGGISDFSKSHKIKLLRGNLNNPEVYLFNIRDLNDMKTANFLLKANDIIYVETRPKYASRIISEISPYLSLLTSVLFVYALFLK